MEQPEIAEVAVVAAADPVRGEVPVAYVVLHSPAEVRNWSAAAARIWRPSKCLGAFTWWKNFRATRWERSRSIC